MPQIHSLQLDEWTSSGDAGTIPELRLPDPCIALGNSIRKEWSDAHNALEGTRVLSSWDSASAGSHLQSFTLTYRRVQPSHSTSLRCFKRSARRAIRPGSIAPMSLQTFEQVRPWARSIRERVLGRQMPPWHIDKTVGVHEFKNDRSLSDDEIATIVKWVDAGAPQGNPNDMP